MYAYLPVVYGEYLLRTKEADHHLAEKFCVSPATARTLGAVISKAGLRPKARGGHRPTITRLSAINFWLACMVGKHINRSTVHKSVKKMIKLEHLISLRPDDLPDDFKETTANFYRLKTAATSPFLKRRGPHVTIQFPDYLLVVSDLLEREIIRPEQVKIEFQPERYSAEVTFFVPKQPTDFDPKQTTKPTPIIERDCFEPAIKNSGDTQKMDQPLSAISFKASVSGHALMEIIQITENPLAAGGNN